MSRIGKLPINIPSGVTITVDSSVVTVSGSKGTLTQSITPGIKIEVKEGELQVTRESDQREHRSWHGLMRSLVNNMIIGVTEGFSKSLELNGVGFRMSLEGDKLKMSLGFSHEVIYQIPEGVSAVIEQNVIKFSGINKQQVGQVAAEVRSLRKPEPYKGKGFKYVDERIIRKSGKSAKEKT